MLPAGVRRLEMVKEASAVNEVLRGEGRKPCDPFGVFLCLCCGLFGLYIIYRYIENV